MPLMFAGEQQEDLNGMGLRRLRPGCPTSPREVFRLVPRNGFKGTLEAVQRSTREGKEEGQEEEEESRKRFDAKAAPFCSKSKEKYAQVAKED